MQINQKEEILKKSKKIADDELAQIKRIEGAVAEIKKACEQMSRIQLNKRLNGQKAENVPHDFILVVQQIVSKNAGVKLTSITHQASRGKERVCDARMIAMALCAKYKFASTREIANRFGREDHSTVLHACKRSVTLMGVNNWFRDLYNKCDDGIQTVLNENKEPEYYI